MQDRGVAVGFAENVCIFLNNIWLPIADSTSESESNGAACVRLRGSVEAAWEAGRRAPPPGSLPGRWSTSPRTRSRPRRRNRERRRSRLARGSSCWLECTALGRSPRGSCFPQLPMCQPDSFPMPREANELPPVRAIIARGVERGPVFRYSPRVASNSAQFGFMLPHSRAVSGASSKFTQSIDSVDSTSMKSALPLWNASASFFPAREG